MGDEKNFHPDGRKFNFLKSIFRRYSLFFFCFLCLLSLLFFACLFICCFLKLKMYILIHIRLCGRVSYKKIFTWPISGNQTSFLGLIFFYFIYLFIYFFWRGATPIKLPINIRLLYILFATQKGRIGYVKSSQNLTHCNSTSVGFGKSCLFQQRLLALHSKESSECITLHYLTYNTRYVISKQMQLISQSCYIPRSHKIEFEEKLLKPERLKKVDSNYASQFVTRKTVSVPI